MRFLTVLMLLIFWHIEYFDASNGNSGAMLDRLNQLSNKKSVRQVLPGSQMRYWYIIWSEEVKSDK